MRRINDVNPRNGSATSLANSQSSPSPPVPPVLPCSPGTPLPSFCLAVSAPAPSCHPWDPPSSVRVRPRHDPKNLRRDPAAGPLPSLVACTPALSFAVFTCLQHHPLAASTRRLRYHSPRTLLLRRPPPSPPSPASCPRNFEITDSRVAVSPGFGRTARKGFLHLSTYGAALLSPPLQLQPHQQHRRTAVVNEHQSCTSSSAIRLPPSPYSFQ